MNRFSLSRIMWAATLVALTLAAGCASDPTPPNPFRGEVPQSERTIQVFVENLDFNDATLHAVADGGRIRMGTVNGKQHSTFTVTWPYVRDLSVHISQLAGDDFTTRRLTVSPGETVRLFIQRPVQRSYLIR